jgi:hypothetical protein
MGGLRGRERGRMYDNVGFQDKAISELWIGIVRRSKPTFRQRVKGMPRWWTLVWRRQLFLILLPPGRLLSEVEIEREVRVI